MKFEKIIIGILIVVIIGACILLALDKRKYVNDNKKLKEENSKLQEQLNNQNNKVLDNKEEVKTCTYTKTYRFIENYDFVGTVPTEKFIVVDQFQEFSPVIIRYDSAKYNIDFEKDAYYEFTFTSFVSDYGENKKTITNIVKTDKQGFDQINESCKVR